MLGIPERFMDQIYDDEALALIRQPVYWILGIGLSLGWLATINSAGSTPPGQKNKPVTGPSLTKWLVPYLTTSTRRYAAMVFYAAMLGLEGLEIFWFSKTSLKVMSNLLSFSFHMLDADMGEESKYVTSMLIHLMGILCLLAFSGIVVLFTVSCIYELVAFGTPKGPEPLAKKGGKAE
jgi:hypothetical protein